MTHIAEDELLKYALEITDSDSQRDELDAHLRACPECSARLRDIQKDIGIIGGVSPNRRLLRMSNPRARRVTINGSLKAAALIIFGIFVGFGASTWVYREPAAVRPAYMALSPPDDTLVGCAVSDATEIPHRYYDEILRGQN
jgi:hypothetical protein